MKNRLKYKVWNKKDKQWCNGIVLTSDGVLYSTDHKICLYEDTYIIFNCTGLKDKNEKLIYEGDIVRTHTLFNQSKRFRGRVKWIEQYAQFNLVDTGGIVEESEALYEFIDDIEIIGNIYENSKLIS